MAATVMSELLDDLHTVRDWLRWGTSRFNEAKLFFGHGCDNAHDEAAWLVLHALHLPPDRPDQIQPYLDARLTRHERLAVLELLQQRIARRLPAAYLTHEAWQAGLRFYVDERVLVPRSYFADLLVDGFAPWIDDPYAIESALDLCTGSGCLAILMAHAFPNAQIDAADISPDALEVAKRNVAEYDLKDRIRLAQGDLFGGLGKRRYDFILSNPPYVTAQAMLDLPPEYRHEPENALAAGDDDDLPAGSPARLVVGRGDRPRRAGRRLHPPRRGHRHRRRRRKRGEKHEKSVCESRKVTADERR